MAFFSNTGEKIYSGAAGLGGPLRAYRDGSLGHHNYGKLASFKDGSLGVMATMISGGEW
jgi:hypothetical protein